MDSCTGLTGAARGLRHRSRYKKQSEPEQAAVLPTAAKSQSTARARKGAAAPAAMAAALTRQSSAGLARTSSAHERSMRLDIERSTRTLEAATAKVEAELRAAQTEIELLRAKVTELAVAGGQFDRAGGDLDPIPRTLSEEEKAALLTKLSNIPIHATDQVAAIVKEYCGDEDEDLDVSALPTDALLRIQELLSALATADTGETGPCERVAGAMVAHHQRAPPGDHRLHEVDREPLPSKNVARRRPRASTGFFQPNLAAVQPTSQQAAETNASPRRRARPEDLSRSRSTRGNSEKIRATETPSFHQAGESQPSQALDTTHSSNETVSRTSTFADLLQEIGEVDEKSLSSEQVTARPVTFSFVGGPAGLSMDRTSTAEMTEADMNRTSTVAMAPPEPTHEEAAFVGEVNHTVSIIAACQSGGADTRLAAEAIRHLAKLVQDSQGKVVYAKQIAVAEASRALLIRALTMYAAVPAMQIVTLGALLSVSRDNPSACEALWAAGGADVVPWALATHVGDARLQLYALALGSQLAQHGGTGVRAALAGANMVEAIATAMRTHSHDGLILNYSCTTLNALLCEPSVAQHVGTQIWNFGIVQLVQAALPLHVGNNRFERLRQSAEQLAELMSQAAARAAHRLA